MVTVRRVTPEDGPAVREIRLRALRSDPDAFGSTYGQEMQRAPELWIARVAASASGHDQCLFVAEAKTGLVGMIGGYTPTDDPTHRHLYGLWVAPEARRAGVATALVEAVRNWAASVQAAELDLWVNDSNGPALRLYQRLGFIDAGKSKPLPSNPRFTESLLSIPLG